MKLKNTTEIGRYGEDMAAKLLRKKGYKILERNFRAGHNEIDIIAQNKDYTVFVEVKTRSEHKIYGLGAADSNFGMFSRDSEITDKIVDDGEYLICYSSINNIFYFICLDDVGNMKIHGKSNNIIGILTFR